MRLQHVKDFCASTSQGGFMCHTGVHDDGTQWAVHFNVVMITLNNGREFYLPNGQVVWVHDEDGSYQTVRGEYEPGAMVDKVIAKGVDLKHWLEVERMSLSSILADELEREDWERSYGAR